MMMVFAVGTGGGAAVAGPEEVGTAAGEPSRDNDGAGADELTGGDEVAAAADDDVTGALGSELAEAVGPATRGDVDVHALKQRTAPTAIAATQRVGPITKEGCPGRPRRTRSAIRRRWPSGTRNAYPFLRPSR